MASVMGAKAEPVEVVITDAEEYIIDLGIRNYGAKYLGLTDIYREDEALVVREYEVWAYPTKVGKDSVKLFEVGDKSYRLGVLNGGTVTPAEGFKFATYSKQKAKGDDYYWKMDSLERLYRFGMEEVYIFVVPGYKDSVKQTVAKRYDTEVNRAMFDYYFKMKLEPILMQCAITMCSDFEKDTTYHYSLSDNKTSQYPNFMMDSAALGFTTYGMGQDVEFQWQRENALDPRAERVWSDFGGVFMATGAQMSQGYSSTLHLQFTEGGYRNQYWRLLYRPVGTTKWSESKELDFFPSYPFELIGPIAIGSGYSKRNVEAGERDTIWKYYGGTEAFTGSEEAPCNNLIVATPACKIDTLKSGLLQATQPGAWITIQANERKTVKLTFLNKDTTLYAVETCACGGSKLPAAPEGYEVDQLTWTWATAYTYTKDQFLAEEWTEDKSFYITFKLLSSLSELKATLPADAKIVNVLGQEVGEGYKGVVLIGGKKYLIE